jgi:hypothetical protein
MEYELYHYGVKGMKWGVRRYQNKDGSLTPAGKKRIQESGEFLRPRYSSAREYNNPRLRRKVANNRLDVSDEYNRKQRAIPDDDRFGKRGKLVLDTIDKYADATIKDLKLKNTDQTKTFVKNHLNDSLAWYHRATIDDYRKYEVRKNDTRSLKEKIDAVNADYTKRIKRAEQQGNGGLADMLQTEWANAVDEEYWYYEHKG